MKKTFLILTAVLVTGLCQAQTTALKINLPSIVFGNASIMGEHAISNKLSVAANLSFTAMNKMIELPDKYSEYQQIIDDAKSTAFTAELRWYPSPSTGVMRNFYAAPYVRFAKYKTQYDGVAHIDDFGDINYQAEGHINEVGAGLQLGYQWVISNRVVIDWFFLGPRYSTFKANASATGPTTELEFYAAVPLDKFVDSGAIPAEDVTVTVTNEGANANAKASSFALRSGFAIGICF